MNNIKGGNSPRGTNTKASDERWTKEAFLIAAKRKRFELSGSCYFA